VTDLLVFSRVKTRLQVQSKRKPTDSDPSSIHSDHYDSTLDAISKIVADEGITGLYSGMNGALLGVASTNFAYFYWYSVVRTLYESSLSKSKPPSTAVELSLGAIAGAVAQVFTIPVSVITTRQQTQNKHDKKGFFDTGKEVLESEDGVSGLWRGLKASLVLVVNPAITYGAYQRLRDLFFPQKVNLRPWEAFCQYPTPIMPHLKLTRDSSGSNVQGARNYRNTAIDRRKGRTTVKTSSGTKRQAFQDVW
jgi:Mitochondrial carrier protein